MNIALTKQDLYQTKCDLNNVGNIQLVKRWPYGYINQVLISKKGPPFLKKGYISQGNHRVRIF